MYSQMPKRVKRENFCRYFHQLCRNSLITGFPVIVSTKSALWKVVKSCIFLLCLGGFFYQSTDFLGMYLSYPTIVDVGMSIPTTVEMPAVTVCNKNRMKRKLYCKDDENNCLVYNNREIFCSLFKSYCRTYESAEDIVLSVPNFSKLYDTNSSWAYLNALGFHQDDIFDNCILKMQDELSQCSRYVPVPAVDSLGLPNNCFAVGSLWELPEAEPNIQHTSASIVMSLNMQPQEYMNPNDMIQSYISVHDAYSLVNPFMEGMMIESGKIYNIYITEEVKVLLPPPFKTNCTDYLKIWRKNGGTGPVNQKMCTEKCKLDELLKGNICIDATISYPHNFPLCKFGVYTVTPSIIEHCSMQCPPACEEKSYLSRVEVTSDLGSLCEEDDYVCPKEKIILKFVFSRMQITKFEHFPKYESVEMFSYIGGYMGMWLGISLVALFDFLETLVRLFCYPFKIRMAKKKRRVRDAKRFPAKLTTY